MTACAASTVISIGAFLADPLDVPTAMLDHVAVSDQAVGTAGMALSGTARDPLHLIDLLYAQHGGLRPEVIITDAGYLESNERVQSEHRQLRQLLCLGPRQPVEGDGFRTSSSRGSSRSWLLPLATLTTVRDQAFDAVEDTGQAEVEGVVRRRRGGAHRRTERGELVTVLT